MTTKLLHMNNNFIQRNAIMNKIFRLDLTIKLVYLN